MKSRQRYMSEQKIPMPVGELVGVFTTSMWHWVRIGTMLQAGSELMQGTFVLQNPIYLTSAVILYFKDMNT